VGSFVLYQRYLTPMWKGDVSSAQQLAEAINFSREDLYSFELICFLVLILPQAVSYFLMGGVLLHIGIYVAMAASFFEYIVLSWFHRFRALFGYLISTFCETKAE
jgi:hypothetical protein